MLELVSYYGTESYEAPAISLHILEWACVVRIVGRFIILKLQVTFSGGRVNHDRAR